VEQRRGAIAGAFAYSLWGLFPLFFHHLAPTGPLEVLGHRIVWSFVVVSVVLRATGRAGGIAVLRADGRRAARIALAALLLAVNWLTYLWAVNNGRIVDAALGYFINPLLSVALGVLVLGERLRRAQVWALMLGAVAVVILTVGYGKLPWVALTLATTFGAYGFLKKTIVVPGAIESLAAESAVLLPIAIVGFAIALAGPGITFGHHGVGNVALLVLTGPVTAVPLVLFAYAAHRIPLTLVGLLMYLTPVGQFLCGVLVFHEAVPIARLAGFALVWAALVILTVDAVRHYRNEAPTPVLVGPLPPDRAAA